MSKLLPSIFNKDTLFNFPTSVFNKDSLFNFPTFLQELEQLQNGERNQGLTIYDEKNNIFVEAALPGLKSDEIEVNLNKGILWIKGEKKEEETEKDKKYYRKSIRSFSYSIALPDQVDESQEPKASYKDGILKISFQKAKTSEAKRIAVKSEK